jgi:hypothetical protein
MMNAQGYNAQGYDPSRMTAAMQADPSKISAGISGYMNPYEQQVIDQTSADLQRQNQALQTQNAGAASAAGAFGGSRHGLVEAQTNADTQRQLATTSANLRNQGWNTAASLSGQDVGNQMNVNAANQSSQNAARANNQNAMNSAGQWNAGAQNAAGQWNAGAQNSAAANNQASQNAAGQWNAGAQNQFGQNQFGNAMAGAAQMGNLGNQSFGYGNQLNNQMWQQGQAAQDMNNAIIGQGAGMFDRYTGQPLDILNNRLGALGANPLTQTGTQTGTSQYNPGMMDYLGLAAGTAGAAMGGK